MIVYELSVGLASRIMPLFTDIPFDQPCYESIFEGIQTARIFVDHPDSPTAALLIRSHDYFVAGALDPALRQFIKDTPQEPGVFQDLYGLVPANLDWERALLEDLPLEVVPRQNFQWQSGTPAPDWRSQLPANGEIVPITDRSLAEQLDQTVFPVPFIDWNWGGYENYLKHGFGFCLLIGGQIASVIFSIATTRKYALISIDTEERFRKRGFATLLGARFIDHCLQHNLLPVWDCDRDNIPSAATARRLGFVEKQPFSELAMPNRAKVPLSSGLWQAGPSQEITIWRR